MWLLHVCQHIGHSNVTHKRRNRVLTGSRLHRCLGHPHSGVGLGLIDATHSLVLLNRPSRPCSGCGSQQTQAGSREAVCPAWGKTCHKCGVKNHFSRVCQYRVGAAYHVSGEVPLTSDEDSVAMLSLIAHITFNQDNGTYKQGPCGVDVVEICAQITPFSPNPEPRDSVHVPDCNVTTAIRIFPDSGASICLGGTKHLQQLGLKSLDTMQ